MPRPPSDLDAAYDALPTSEDVSTLPLPLGKLTPVQLELIAGWEAEEGDKESEAP